MTLDREKAIGDIAQSAREIYRVVYRPTTLDSLGRDLTLAQLKALIALAGRKPVTVGALGQMLQIQLPAASHAAAGLVRMDLARRLKDPCDRRCTYIQLTPHAEELVDQLREDRRGAFYSLLVGLSDEELAAAQRGLRAIAAAAARQRATEPTGAEGAAPEGRFGSCLDGQDVRTLEEEIS